MSTNNAHIFLNNTIADIRELTGLTFTVAQVGKAKWSLRQHGEHGPCEVAEGSLNALNLYLTGYMHGYYDMSVKRREEQSNERINRNVP